ncbi:TauD/TfdA family dioxygenase [Nonomuraea sp. NPDC050786]|uniref:TauD/TfdA family dioxygenase n=1 Tax=Nonomuraea sp. NPDC050786 TaxID=3154840 RepID=UPI00340EA643
MPLTNEDFLRFGRLLGNLIAETDPVVQPYVEREFILNLRTERGSTADVFLRPFATSALSLHTEGSGRATGDQPRYIVLMCCEPGADASAATVLVPMDAVSGRLSEEDLYLLSHTRYRGRTGVPTIARRVDHRIVYSFRDFQGTPLEWECAVGSAPSAAVHAAFRSLLAAMYARQGAYAVQWSRGLLVVIDNFRFFHGRSSGHSRLSGKPRHLMRLRIQSPAGQA